MAQASKKKSDKVRKWLLFLWLGFFLLNIMIVLYLFLDHWIEADNFKAAMKQLNAAYAPFVGVMLLFYWAGSGKVEKVKTGLPFKLAFAGSLLWNGMMLAFLVLLPIEAALEHSKDIGALFSWLVAGAIGYYFARPG